MQEKDNLTASSRALTTAGGLSALLAIPLFVVFISLTLTDYMNCEVQRGLCVHKYPLRQFGAVLAAVLFVATLAVMLLAIKRTIAARGGTAATAPTFASIVALFAVFAWYVFLMIRTRRGEPGFLFNSIASHPDLVIFLASTIIPALALAWMSLTVKRFGLGHGSRLWRWAGTIAFAGTITFSVGLLAFAPTYATRVLDGEWLPVLTFGIYLLAIGPGIAGVALLLYALALFRSN